MSQIISSLLVQNFQKFFPRTSFHGVGAQPGSLQKPSLWRCQQTVGVIIISGLSRILLGSCLSIDVVSSFIEPVSLKETRCVMEQLL